MNYVYLEFYHVSGNLIVRLHEKSFLADRRYHERIGDLKRVDTMNIGTQLYGTPFVATENTLFLNVCDFVRVVPLDDPVLKEFESRPKM